MRQENAINELQTIDLARNKSSQNARLAVCEQGILRIFILLTCHCRWYHTL